MPSPKDIIADIHEIGSLPQSLAAVLNALDDPNTGADEIGELISKDVSLTTRVLRMVNSARYGRRRKVTRISEAVMVMGLNSIKMLTLSSSIFGILPDDKLLERCDIKRIWRHLIETAANARNIAGAMGYPDPEEAFVAGIVHDVGIIIMLLYFKEKYIDLIQTMKKRKTGLCPVEYDALGFTHGDVGAEMINAWRIPPKLAYVVQNHHSPNNLRIVPEDSTLNDIVALADRLTLGPFNDYFPDIKDNITFIRTAQIRLGLSPEATRRIRKESVHQTISLAEYLELDVGDLLEILTQANEMLAEMYFSLERLYFEHQGDGELTVAEKRESII